eukprot:CAMPEP_0116138168 /NCGR_PEP_ID=MMETSP0329-20121206/12643_1 /TAXON_ID=697910 /ORGANISM="Pseudo-nitzschia arenysensis, Strain B593" /LENGTH=1590 /DNA_ID=CAMNT_0003633143 /DNA_START=88 /DNA_END=4860 /DNA_ORIENTATION=+
MDGNTEDTSIPDTTEVAQPESVVNDEKKGSEKTGEDTTAAKVNDSASDTGSPDMSDSKADETPDSDAQEPPKENNEISEATEDDQPPSETVKEEGKGGSSNSSGVSTPVGQNMGAQILMNRFSTWRKTANEKLNTQAPVLQENAKQAQEYAQRMLKNNSLSSVMPSMGLTSRFAAAQKPETAPSAETTTDEKSEAEKAVVKDEVRAEEETAVTSEQEKQEVDDSSAGPETTPSPSSSSLLDNDEAGGGEEDEKEDENASEQESKDEGSAIGSVFAAPESRERVRAVFSRASTSMAESVATGFRGRYTQDASTKTTTDENNSADSEPKKLTLEESQMALILKSRAGAYMQDILDKLEHHEFAMLLGRGMLGVNLKQCYLKNHGIFVDFLIENGQAAQSGLIRPGDLMVRLGDVDFRKGTIRNVPLEIAKAKRPAVLVLSTGTKVPIERVNFVDVAIAMMHRARNYYEDRGTYSILPSSRENTSTGISDAAEEESVQTSEVLSSEKEEKNDPMIPSTTPQSVCDVTIESYDNVEAYSSPPWPSIAVRKEFIEETALRSVDNFVVSDLCEVLDMDTNFRAAIRNAFLVCALDSRRLPFLARHLSKEERRLVSDNGEAVEDGENNMAPSAQLMLFLELASFLDLYDITPPNRLRDVASRIAYKFFLPTKIGNGIQPPLFDFHHIVPYSSLRHLEFVLSGKSELIPRDLFLDFQRSIVDSLSGAPFLSFLASFDCSRMRAYLRDTAPFVNLPFKHIMDAMAKGTEKAKDTAAAHNSFTYILIYLLCRMEKEANGEHNFTIENEQNRRLLGATNDICCALYIKRNLLPAIESASKQGEGMTGESCENFLGVVEQFWDLYLSDDIEPSTRNAEIEGFYNKVRTILQSISKQTYDASDSTQKTIATSIVKSKLAEQAAILADEILYDYAANPNTKFRDHKFHEWISNEFSKVLSGDPYWYRKQTVPVLPQGCLKRFLRKVELPSGVSSHKPYKITAKEDSGRSYQNAEWAVVFGSSVGAQLASQMPVPGLDSHEIRRYTCLPVALDKDHADCDDFRPEEVLPATFESYAFVPPSKPKPFQSIVDAGRVTVDGWEVSLVTFTIPNADSSSSGDATESALYGVSLCFQEVGKETKGYEKVGTKLIYSEEKIEEGGINWESPICFETISTEERDETVRKVNISSKVPVFEQHLQEKTWVDRVKEEEYRDQSSNIAIGIALVSRRNVVFAMRDTLSRLFFDYSRQPGQSLEDAKSSTTCGALVELLGACSYQNHEGSVLRVLLEPYLRVSSSPWIDRPLAEQETMFESHALRQLTDCLPPTSLALLFVTALLEQKIIFSSGRRSVLHAASVGLAALLRPLKWSHLLVPMVPGALASDLIQYPAPFILGVPSEDADSMDLLGNLPRDVTLVDLDVGRVILAPDFGKENEMCRGTTDVQATARALRSQVLYLAQGLGTVFGNSLRPDSWICDEPFMSEPTPGTISNDTQSITTRLDNLRASAKSFIEEVLEGSISCCYWIEEMTTTYGTNVEPTVLFDEDKFFEIKNHRATQAWKPLFPKQESNSSGPLALVLDDFDLVLESFLRCQSMSIYISSRPKKGMFYY